jgi:hypothetical protein
MSHWRSSWGWRIDVAIDSQEDGMREPGAPIRIWYQSFVDPDAQAPYMERLQARLRLVAAAEVTVNVHGIRPPDRHFHPITEFRCAGQTIHAALRAESEGYDAFVIGHFQEPGLTECRGAVDIPVIGLGEATLLHACSMGRRIGLITIDPIFHSLARGAGGPTRIATASCGRGRDQGRSPALHACFHRGCRA